MAIDSLKAAIKPIDATTYELPRSLVDKAFANPIEVVDGRIVPAAKDGKSTGMKLYSIRPNSLLATVGLQNGDVIKAINDISVVEPNLTFESLRTATVFRVAIDRRGAPVVLTWRIK